MTVYVKLDDVFALLDDRIAKSNRLIEQYDLMIAQNADSPETISNFEQMKRQEEARRGTARVIVRDLYKIDNREVE